MNKKQMAGTALAASIIGAGATAPLAGGSFLGGLVHNGFLAASIGGLADWFAVTALFRKPLGISYRTEILIRNRQRIMQAVVDFAGHDLLNTDNIMGFIDKRDVSKMLLAYFKGPERKKMLACLDSIFAETLAGIDTRKLSAELSPVLAHELKGENMIAAARRISKGIATSKTAENLLPFLLVAMRCALENDTIKTIIKANLDEVLAKYEGNGAGRAFVMGLIGLDSDKLYETLQDKAYAYITRLENWDVVDGLEKLAHDDEEARREATEDAELYRQAIVLLTAQLEQIMDSQRVIDALSDFLSSMVNAEQIQILIEKWLNEQLVDKRGHWQEYLCDLADRKINEFIRNDEWQKNADSFIKDWLRKELEKNHHVIISMIEDRLSQLTDEKLVEFVEPKVSDDLQMIRINGSIVGGLAGMALYVVTYIAGQVLTR